MENSELRAPHQPEMERGDVRVADEDFGIPAEEIRLEVWNHSHSAVAASCGNDRFDLGIAPHLHQAFRALLIFAVMKTSFALDLGFQDHFEAGLLHRFDPSKQPIGSWRI